MDSTRAIIIKSETSGEADSMVTAFTDFFGKEIFVARGARHMAAKLRNDLQPFSLAQVSWVQGKQMKVLVGAKVIERFITQESSLDDLVAAQILADVVNRLIAAPARDERLFAMLLASFRALAARGDHESWRVVQRFFWSLCILEGLFVPSDTCRACGTAFANGIARFIDGEFLCGQCAADRGATVPLASDDRAALNYILNGKGEPHINRQSHLRLNDALVHFIMAHVPLAPATRNAYHAFLACMV